MQQMTHLLAEIWQALCPWINQIDSGFDSQSNIWNCLVGSSSSGQGSNPQDNSRLEVNLYHCISGPITLTEAIPRLSLEDSILDKGQARNEGEETSGLAILAPGTDTEIFTTTVLGMTTVRSLEASNSLFTEKVVVRLHQTGCIRFSHVPEGSQTPPRYQCQPDMAFQEALDPIPDAITSIASHASYLFSSSAGGGVFRFPNDRETWGKANQGLSNPYVATLLAYAEPEATTVLAGTTGGKIFRSNTNGRSNTDRDDWVPIPISGATATITVLVPYDWPLIGTLSEDKRTIEVRVTLPEPTSWIGYTISVGNSVGKQTPLITDATVDQSAQTTTLTLDATINNSHNTITFHVNTVLAATAGDGIFRGNVNGENWTPIKTGLTNLDVRALAVSPQGTVYAGTAGDGVFQLIHEKLEENEGDLWIPINEELKNYNITALAIDTHGIMFVGTAGRGVFRINNGTDWVPINQGLSSLDITAVITDKVANENNGETVIIAATADGKIFRLINGREPWKQLGLDLYGLNFTTLAVTDEMLLVGTAAGSIYSSKDKGESWQAINAGLPNVIEKLLIMEQLQPNFTSTYYGDPGYAQLSQNCANELRTGAEDGAEMGTFNGLKQPQREANLQANLEEYLRFGLEAGIFYAT
jgi:photosystem II stability/assembly factor-like uncharacterized protein